MWKFKRNSKSVPKYVKRNHAPSEKRSTSDLFEVQKNIYRQAGLALLTVVLTIVILFAMTSAWYTNIVQTSGLVFEAESWGFKGEIKVNKENIPASPGDNGLIHLEVKNGSDQISAISVNISKDAMEEKMKQRLFFYVDTPMTRNEEIMERVYINELESYTYTLFNNGKLTLTDKIHNAAQLKWQWVYDVLGYYVLAERHDVQAKDGTQKQLLSIKEYLRPIEYDYDAATFKVQNDETGKQTYVLATVDGKITPQEFLQELSKKDGYPGQIGDPLENGSYPVSVDEDGYGVYAYLCTYAEIQEATEYDTWLGELAYSKEHGAELSDTDVAKLFNKANLTISAQKNEIVVANVHALSGLEMAISKGTADAIQLSGDITIPSDGNPLRVEGKSKIMLDLNGYDLVSDLEGTAIEVMPGSSLTVINGNMIGPGEEAKQSCGIYATGAEVVLSNVTMESFDNGLYLRDDLYKNEQDSHIYIVDSEIKSDSIGIVASGNGSLSDQPTQLIVENSTLYGEVYGLSGNGDSSGTGRWGTDIQLINSNISSNSEKLSAGLYHPQKDSTLLIYNSTVSGYTGLAVKGGSVTIEDSEISGKGNTFTEPKIENSGFTDTADAVYVETGYDYDILLEIRGESVLNSIAEGSCSLRVFEKENPCVAIRIYSGTFDQEQPDAYIAPGSVRTGKTVSIDKNASANEETTEGTEATEVTEESTNEQPESE